MTTSVWGAPVVYADNGVDPLKIFNKKVDSLELNFTSIFQRKTPLKTRLIVACAERATHRADLVTF